MAALASTVATRVRAEAAPTTVRNFRVNVMCPKLFTPTRPAHLGATPGSAAGTSLTWQREQRDRVRRHAGVERVRADTSARLRHRHRVRVLPGVGRGEAFRSYRADLGASVAGK